VRFEGWEPPPPPPAPRAAAPARAFVGPTVPAVPPFGYTLVGRVEEGVTARAVLHSDLRSLSVAAGDVIDGQWQVEAVEATQLTLVWMPTRQRQVVAMAQK
jgi:hypothetical protein